tara:strand:- start:396 stop:734 length:339 start_codon:yes stop_codon:yes gene_type:complete
VGIHVKNWMFNPEFLATDNNEGHDTNALIQYLQEQPADVLQRVAKSASPEIQEIIRHNVQGLLGMLPGEQFEVKVTSSKDNLAKFISFCDDDRLFLKTNGAKEAVRRDPFIG